MRGTRPAVRRDRPPRLPDHPALAEGDQSRGGPAGCGLPAPFVRKRLQGAPVLRLGADSHRQLPALPADPPLGLPPGPRHLLHLLGPAGGAGDDDAVRLDSRAALAVRSRPPLLPVKRDLSFTAALLVLLPAFRRFLPGVVPSGPGWRSRAGGPCARGARASAARRR